MILRKGALKILAVFTCSVICFILSGLPVNAATPQEDPYTAIIVFSGTSLFQFYSGTLDFDLVRNQQSIEANIQVSPFANIPPAIADSFNNFLTSADTLCGQIKELDSGENDIRILLSQSRYAEAVPLIKKAYDNITQGMADLDTIEQATNIAGGQFKINNASGGSGLRLAFQAVLDRIKRLRDLLVLDLSLLPPEAANKDITESQLAQILSKNPLILTEITLQVTPTEAFVGDTISVRGTLSANNNPLGNRQVELMLNSSTYLTLETDAQGHYSSLLQVPYWYIPTIQIQSLYYPQADDKGVYASALSIPINLKVLYYEATLTLKTDKVAYPGLETSIVGQFDYGSAPLPDTRNIEISLDNSTIKATEKPASSPTTKARNIQVSLNSPVADTNEVPTAFTETILLPADLKPGVHIITISVAASGRYAPVVTNTTLTVTKVTPVLSIKVPSVAFIPGSFTVQGKLDSELGPVAQAKIIITYEGKPIETVSNEDGTFSATIRNGMGFGLFGSQKLKLSVSPIHPWQNDIASSHKIMAIYFINCFLFLLILIIIGILLPNEIKFRIGKRQKKKLSQGISVPQQVLPMAVAALETESIGDSDKNEKKTPHGRLLYWYRIVIQLIQRVSGRLLKPAQTLREFIRDTGQATGLARKPILEFTRMMERVLYSKHQVTEEDVKSGEQLAHQVQESLKK